MRLKSECKRFLFCALILGVSQAASAVPQRIVTLAPGLTEIVFALGRGADLVGVTRFCDFPQAARTLPRVGGLLDLDLEMVLSRQPRTIILYPEMVPRLRALRSRARLLVVSHGTLADLYDSIRQIAAELHEQPSGERLCRRIETRLKRISVAVGSRPRQKTLLIAGRESVQLRNMVLIGRRDFINDVLAVCGGENAYRGAIPYPIVSLESVLAMDPGCVVELSAFYEGLPENVVRRHWAAFPRLRAVVDKRIHFVRENHWLRPGPRVSHIADELLNILHPGVVVR